MEIRILGAHNLESATARMVSLLIDGVLAIDAGSLTSTLSLTEQEDIKSILLSHCHLDHIIGIPAIALNHFIRTIFDNRVRTVKVYGTMPTIDALSSYLVTDLVHPSFTDPRSENPVLKFFTIEPYKAESVDGYKVLALPVNHSVPTVGYQITSGDGKSLFYSADTGPGLSSCWHYVTATLLVMELMMPNRFVDLAQEKGHLTPQLLGEELTQFRQIKGYIPPVILVHMNNELEDEIKKEVAQMATELGATISFGYAGMRIIL